MNKKAFVILAFLITPGLLIGVALRMTMKKEIVDSTPMDYAEPVAAISLNIPQMVNLVDEFQETLSGVLPDLDKLRYLPVRRASIFLYYDESVTFWPVLLLDPVSDKEFSQQVKDLVGSEFSMTLDQFNLEGSAEFSMMNEELIEDLRHWKIKKMDQFILCAPTRLMDEVSQGQRFTIPIQSKTLNEMKKYAQENNILEYCISYSPKFGEKLLQKLQKSDLGSNFDSGQKELQENYSSKAHELLKKYKVLSGHMVYQKDALLLNNHLIYRDPRVAAEDHKALQQFDQNLLSVQNLEWDGRRLQFGLELKNLKGLLTLTNLLQ